MKREIEYTLLVIFLLDLQETFVHKEPCGVACLMHFLSLRPNGLKNRGKSQTSIEGSYSHTSKFLRPGKMSMSLFTYRVYLHIYKYLGIFLNFITGLSIVHIMPAFE